MQKVKFFTLSWSVRAASYHSAVLKALVDNSPDYIDIVMGDISHYLCLILIWNVNLFLYWVKLSLNFNFFWFNHC
jgi:hypothetical protein